MKILTVHIGLIDQFLDVELSNLSKLTLQTPRTSLYSAQELYKILYAKQKYKIFI